MTTPPASRGVVARAGSGTLSWRSGVAAAVAEVEVLIAPGIRIQVDAASPGVVLAWTVEEHSAPADLAGAVQDGSLVDAIIRARAGDIVELGPSELSQRWARRALTEAVSRWRPSGVNESALFLDEAASHQKTGNTLAAARLVALAAPTLRELGRLRLDGYLGGGAAAELTEITRLAAEAVAGRGWGMGLRELARELEAVTAFDDADLESWLASLVREQTDQLAMSLSGPGEQDVAAQVTKDLLDPAAVPARVFSWRGATSRELRAEHHSATDEAVVTVTLADHLDPEVVEDGQFTAYMVDRDSGQLLCSAEMARRGRTLVARLQLDGAEFTRGVFGVFHADTDLRRLRRMPLSRSLVEVDRLMIESWTEQRAATAILHQAEVTDTDAVAKAQVDARPIMAAARTAATNARNLLDQKIAELHEGSSELSTLLQARRTAIQAFLTTLRKVHVPTDGTHPLLAELLPVEPWEGYVEDGEARDGGAGKIWRGGEDR